MQQSNLSERRGAPGHVADVAMKVPGHVGVRLQTSQRVFKRAQGDSNLDSRHLMNTEMLKLSTKAGCNRCQSRRLDAVLQGAYDHMRSVQLMCCHTPHSSQTCMPEGQVVVQAAAATQICMVLAHVHTTHRQPASLSPTWQPPQGRCRAISTARRPAWTETEQLTQHCLCAPELLTTSCHKPG